MIFKVKVLCTIVSLHLFVGPSAAVDFTYQEYTKAPELWKRGFVFGISRYMSTVAQPILLAPKGQWLRSSSRRCLICAGRKSKRRNRPRGLQAKDEPMPRAPISLSVAAEFGRYGLS